MGTELTSIEPVAVGLGAPGRLGGQQPGHRATGRQSSRRVRPFCQRLPGAGVQYRGCSSPPGHTASNCVYRDGNDLLSLTVSLFPRGWAVTGAVLES